MPRLRSVRERQQLLTADLTDETRIGSVQVRDWLFVNDHCEAIERMLAADVAGETLNVGGEAEHENARIVGLLCPLIDERIGGDPALA